MFFTIIIAIISIIALLVIHEFGHFIIAKKCGVKVEEFGIGYPPRICGKKFGETLYSINLIPFGAFVKVHGETGGIEDYRSFIGKPMWQRFLIVVGGVVSFWIVSVILLSIVAGAWGLPTAVSDEANQGLIDPKVQIVGVLEDSPAGKAGLKLGDIIIKINPTLSGQNSKIKNVDKVKQVQEFTKIHKGEEITLTIKRGEEVLEIPIIPRVSPPEGEGLMGVVLTRVALKPYPWYRTPIQGVKACGYLTVNIIDGWMLGLKNVLGIAKLPPGVKFELMGPLGIFDLLRKYFAMGINYFLFLVSLIAVALALVNILPIPALDGGKLVFLGIETIRRKPISSKIEQKITAVFFILLITLMIYITVKFDIPRVF